MVDILHNNSNDKNAKLGFTEVTCSFGTTFMLLYAAGSCTLGDCNSDQIICAFKAYSLIIVVEGSFSKYQIIPRELAICCF